MCHRGKIMNLNSSFKLCSEFDLFSWDKEIRRNRKTLRKCAPISISVSKSNHQNQNNDELTTLSHSCNEKIPQLFLNLSCFTFNFPHCLFLLHSCSSFHSHRFSTSQAMGEHDMNRKNIRKCLQHVAVSNQVEVGKRLEVT